MMTQMPKVIDCAAEKCAYNREHQCHVLAINVGGSGPVCEAYVTASAKCAPAEITGGVGACKIKDCRFNECLMCAAPGINVETFGSQALCGTYTKR